MNITFITNENSTLSYYRENHFYGIDAVKDNLATFNDFVEWAESTDGDIGFDVESNGLDAWKNSTVLYILGNEDRQFVFHSKYTDFARYYRYLYETDRWLLGHNIKFDIKFGFTECDIRYTKVKDTMLAEQRLYMKSGISMGLAGLAYRYLEAYPAEMDKTIRDEFIGCNVLTFKVEPRHVRYAASDVIHLFPIHEAQKKKITQYNQELLIYGIEFPLIPIIAKAELTGFVFDIDTWMEIYYVNLEEAYRLDCVMDVEVRRLRDSIWAHSPERRAYMTGGKWSHVRQKTDADEIFNKDGSTNVLDLFGEPMSAQTYTGVKKKVVLKPNNISYGSDTQIMEIFGKLDEPLSTKEGGLVIPQFNKKGNIDKTMHSFQTGKPAFNEYLTDLPHSRMKPFIDLLLDHRGMTTACNNFGVNFKDKINPITGNLHTSFRQCFAETGRFQSGGGDKEPDKPNFQNIPSKASYAIKMRNCFMAREGYSIVTADLSGAELIIMCSLSQDMKLLAASKQDMHSHVAQNCWRRIYAHRAKLASKAYAPLAEITALNLLASTYVVDKSKEKKPIRTAFKPMTFGVVYGMYAAKAGRTLNVTKDEGQIIIDFIKEEFPNVISMVERASQFARDSGYLVLNRRTNSRAWFPNICKVLRGEMVENNETFGIISKEKSEARNIKIQGTQADMIKEASVEIQKWIDANGYGDVYINGRHEQCEVTMLSWVHDEIVTEHPHAIDGKSKEWREWRAHDNELYYNHKTYNCFAEVKKAIMIDTCNKYLHNVEMGVDYDIEPYWTK